MTLSSETMFKRNLAYLTEELHTEVYKCISSYLSPNNDDRLTASNKALDAAERLSNTLAPQDRPGWLADLIIRLKLARNQHNGVQSIEPLQEIATRFYPQMKTHSWAFNEPEMPSSVDFDNLFENCRNECRIPELFDQIIAILNEIAQSGHVDSIKMLDALKKVIATLEKARNGSYIATRGAYGFFIAWLRNSGWEYFASIPLLGPAVTGLRKTIDESNDGMTKLHTNFNTALESSVAKNFPRIEYESPEIQALEYHAIDAESQVDVEAVPVEPKESS